MYLKDYEFGGDEEHDGITIDSLNICDETMAKIVLKILKRRALTKPRIDYLKEIPDSLAVKLIRDVFWELELGELEEMQDLFEDYYSDEVDEFVRDEIYNQGLQNEDCIDELDI